MNTGFPVRDLHYLKIRPSYTILNFIMKNLKKKKKMMSVGVMLLSHLVVKNSNDSCKHLYINIRDIRHVG
jgi:hypothetical protein